MLRCPDKTLPNENKDLHEVAYSAKVDVWAIGVLAYELLVGYPPFERESRRVTYECILKGVFDLFISVSIPCSFIHNKRRYCKFPKFFMLRSQVNTPPCFTQMTLSTPSGCLTAPSASSAQR